MSHINLAPLNVVPYSRDYIIEFVRHVTAWHDRGEVSIKAQLEYIGKYLEVDHIACKTIVVESDYIDRHYLEDYAEYYARCFPPHPRKCSRLHFFSENFSEQAFRACLNGLSSNLEKRLKASYIGFAVIRPIPHTVFARVCLKPYPALLDDPRKKLLARKIPVSLFGIELVADAIPFIEQDKVVAACATSALWVSLSAHPDISLSHLPSPSAITKAATNGASDTSRTFPSPGLTPPQMLRGLRHFGLEPSIVWEDSRSISHLKAIAYAYISCEMPVILGGDIYEEGPDGKGFKYVGSHLVCLTGYAKETARTSQLSRPPLESNEIDRFYVHDDRLGPYVRVSLAPKTINLADQSKEQLKGLEMVVHGQDAHYFVPNIAIVGLYHKVRISLDQIRNTCDALSRYLEKARFDLGNGSRTGEDDQKKFDQEVAAALQCMETGRWGIRLVKSNSYKSEVLRSTDFVAFNGSFDRETLLHWNMPRYLWLCRITDNQNEEKFTDIIFDATEVPQGNMLVGYVCWSVDSYDAWGYVSNCVNDRSWQRYRIDLPDASTLVGCFTKFFVQQGNDQFLNTQYGPLGLPRRGLKPGEIDDYANVSRRMDTHTVRRGDSHRNWDFLKQGTKYIWVINEIGDIVIGEDVFTDNEFLGHPTLIDGKPGRVAGELEFKDVNGHSAWHVNLQSRAYSGHVIENATMTNYLEQVVSHNLPGLCAVVDAAWISERTALLEASSI